MYGRILWATDGSPGSDGALAEAMRLLEPGGQLIAFHCDERFWGGRINGQSLFVDEPDRKAMIKGQVEELRDSGVDAELEIEVTHKQIAVAIAAAADHHDVDAIVCGSRGFGAVVGTIAGGVAMRLPHVAACPVIIVSEKAAQHARLTPA